MTQILEKKSLHHRFVFGHNRKEERREITGGNEEAGAVTVRSAPPPPLCPIIPLPLALSHPSFVHYTPPLYFYFGGDQPTFSSLSLSRRSTVLIKHHL